MAKIKAMCIINRTDKLIGIHHEKKHGKGSKNMWPNVPRFWQIHVRLLDERVSLPITVAHQINVAYSQL